MMRKLPFYIYVFLIGIAIAQAVSYFSIMPETMATHFGLGGSSDGWMSKNSFFIFQAFIFLLMFGIFIVIPWAFEKFKVTKMNLPNREYWLSPARISDVYRYFRESFAWFGVVNLAFLIGVMQLVFEANIPPNQTLNNNIFIMLFGGYLVFVIIWLIKFYRKFNKIN